MDLNYISERIAKLCLEKNVSEREVSFSLGKNHGYINTITTRKMTPTIESLIDICDYFGITLFDFFYSEIENPIVCKEIYDEMSRLGNHNLTDFLTILKTLEPSDFTTFLSFMERYKIK